MFSYLLRNALRQEPETSRPFPDEEAFERLLRSDQDVPLRLGIFWRNEPEWQRALLHLLSHMPVECLDPWVWPLAGEALEAPSLGLRDQAVQLCERAAHPQGHALLREHLPREDCDGLRDYIARVLVHVDAPHVKGDNADDERQDGSHAPGGEES
jgi:hypothetical protein